jgi:hypothetical protein
MSDLSLVFGDGMMLLANCVTQGSAQEQDYRETIILGLFSQDFSKVVSG